MRQTISIRYVSMRIIINFIKNIRIGILKTMHPFRGGQLLGYLLIGIISGTNSHESRTRDIILSHVQLSKHYSNALPALKAQ
jgi:hypothetical protein